MKLGVHIGYWGLGLSSQDQLEIVQEAEKLGYDSVWTAEAYGSDAATVLSWLAGQTSKIRLGSGIFQMPGRSAAMTAMTAATIDQLSGGRMILGIGSSGPQVAEGWHGQHFAKQLQRTREYVAVVRMALARDRVEFHGETLELPLPDGPGKALKLTIAPVQEHIPVYLAAIGPKNTALAGEIADGWIPTLFSPEHVSELRPLLQEGADRSGRSLDGFDIAPSDLLALFKLDEVMTMKELAQHMSCDASFVTTIADTLERRGLARREPSLRDRRVKNLVLTPEGIAVKERMFQELALRMPWCYGLDEKERHVFLALIQKMLAAATEHAVRPEGGGAVTAAAAAAS